MTDISGKTISRAAMQEKVRTAVFNGGGPKACAERWSTDKWPISASYIRQVITGAVKPSKPLCKLLGMELVKEIKHRYRKIK